MNDDRRVGTVLADRYRLERLLGVGGMGRVYQAEHVLMRKRLAVKVLHRELTTVPEVVARFEREAMAAAHIEHSHVAAATDFGKLGDGSVFLVLEFVEGKGLRDEIAQGPMSVERALHIARQIASALSAAHDLKIVHRDLKPENVMLVDKGGDPDFVKVLDFGVAKVPIGEIEADEGRPITKAGMVFGTPEYMAPEQALGQPVDGRADLYALGVILFEMLTGVRPFKSKSQVGILGQQLANPPPRIGDRAPGILVPPSVEQLVRCLLDKEADERVATAHEVVTQIDTLLGGAPQYGGRLFTLPGGSPRAAMGSQPRVTMGSDPDSGIIDRPPYASELDSGLVPRPEPPNGTAPGSLGLALPSDVSIGDASGVAAGAGSIASSAAASNGVLPGGALAGGVLSAADSPLGARGIHPHPAGNDATTGADPIGPSSSRRGRALRSSRRFQGLSSRVRAFSPNRSLRLAWDRAQGWVDRGRQRLPAPMRRATTGVPASYLLGAAVLVALVVLVGTLVALTLSGKPEQDLAQSSARSIAVSATAPAPPRHPELDGAIEKGLPAVQGLADKHPKDTSVLLALAELLVKNGKHDDAAKLVGNVLELNSDLKNNPQLARVLFQTAQTRTAGDASFALLKGPMGAPGADILYDLAATRQVRASVRYRADSLMRESWFDGAASTQLQIAKDLRFAKQCEEFQKLLGRAKELGDPRSLPYLRPLRETAGCGADKQADCHPCLRGDAALEEAIKAIEARRGAKAGANPAEDE